MGLRDQTKKRQEEKAQHPAPAPVPGKGPEKEAARKAAPSLVMGTRSVTEARRKGVMVKLLIDGTAEPRLRQVLRELSWMMEPASLGDLFVWVYTQAHLHKDLGRHIKDSIKGSKKTTTKGQQADNRRTNFMSPAHVTEWFLTVTDSAQLQTATRLILQYTLEHWDHIKAVTGWNPAFTDPDENLWTRW